MNETNEKSITLNLKDPVLAGKEFFDNCVERLQAKYANDENVTIQTKSRTILHDENYIYLFLHSENIAAYMTYSDDFFRFLSNKHLCSYSVNTRKHIQIELMQYRYSGLPTFAPMLSRFCYYYYNMGHSAQCLADHFRDISERNREYDIDHVNSNKYINTRWNLASLPSVENARKGTLAERIKPPYIMYPYVMEDGTYRVAYGYAAPSEQLLAIWVHYIKCQDNTALCEFIKTFLNCERLPEEVANFGTPKERYVQNKKAAYGADDFVMAAQVWDKVSALDDSKLQVWPAIQ